jgi:hypothetical protein
MPKMHEGSSLGYVDCMTRRVLSVAALLVTFFSCAMARAEVRPVLVIGGGPSFREAMTVALSPWELRVVPLDAPPPRPTMPRAADEARALVQRSGGAASGLVWVAVEEGESSLWVYDASTEQVVTRRITTPPPFDAPTAAAAALSVKALLRSSTVAPHAERLGAPPPQAAPPPEGDVASADAAVRTALPARPVLRAELEGAGRAIASQLDARAALGVSAWVGERRNVGFALAASFGPGLSVDASRFSGRFAEVGVSPSVRLRVPLGERFALEPRLGMSIHATSIDGVAVRTARAASASRLDASFDAALALDVLATRTLGLALDVGASAMLRYQRYIVESEDIFELHPLQAFAGLRLTTSLL